MKTLFTDIPKPMQERMEHLEDRKDRQDGTPNLKRLRQVPPQSGMLLALLAASAPKGQLVEIGTSGGYSALWLSLAARQRGDKLVTFELLPEKAELARETFDKAQVSDAVELVHGDGRGHIGAYEDIAFAFLDCEKEMYAEFYDELVPRLAPGGLLVADNVISHREALASFVEKARQDERVDAAVLPVGMGLLVCVKRRVG